MRVSEVGESIDGSKVTVKVVDTPLAREVTVKSDGLKSETFDPVIERAKPLRGMVSLPTFSMTKVLTTGVVVTVPKLMVALLLLRMTPSCST